MKKYTQIFREGIKVTGTMKEKPFQVLTWWQSLLLKFVPVRVHYSVDWGCGTDSTVVSYFKKFRGKLYLIKQDIINSEK